MLIEFKLFDAAERKEFHELVKTSIDKFNSLCIVKQNIYDLQSYTRKAIETEADSIGSMYPNIPRSTIIDFIIFARFIFGYVYDTDQKVHISPVYINTSTIEHYAVAFDVNKQLTIYEIYKRIGPFHKFTCGGWSDIVIDSNNMQRVVFNKKNNTFTICALKAEDAVKALQRLLLTEETKVTNALTTDDNHLYPVEEKIAVLTGKSLN